MITIATALITFTVVVIELWTFLEEPVQSMFLLQREACIREELGSAGSRRHQCTREVITHTYTHTYTFLSHFAAAFNYDSLH